eukprot:7493075-Alexandrium_andersonii.AAC.1
MEAPAPPMSRINLRSRTACARAGTWVKASGAPSQACRLASACSEVERFATARLAASSSCCEM